MFVQASPWLLNCRQLNFMCMFSDTVYLVWCQVQRLRHDPRSSDPRGFGEKRRILHFKEHRQTKCGFMVDPNQNNYQKQTSNYNPTTTTQEQYKSWELASLGAPSTSTNQSWAGVKTVNRTQAATQIGGHKEVKTQHRQGRNNRMELWRLSSYF